MPDASLLECFETPSARPIVIEHIGEEFTSNCPKTGHPDFGTVIVRYMPRPPAKSARKGKVDPTAIIKAGGRCVELKSLKTYYHSFRNEGIFYEAVTGRICDDLVAAVDPVWLQVITNWRGRGGIRSIIRADHGDVPPHYRGMV